VFGIEAVIHVIVDQGSLGVRDGLLDRLHLLRDLEAGPSRLDHVDHRPQVAVGAFQPGDQGGMACVHMGLCHGRILSPPQEDTTRWLGEWAATTNGQTGKIDDTSTDIQPTITIRPGWPLRIVVQRDIVLRPYKG